jgi:hypothetical protein
MVDFGAQWKVQIISNQTGATNTFLNGDGILSTIESTFQSDGIPFFELSIINDNGVYNNIFNIGDIVQIWIDSIGEGILIGTTKRFYGFIKTVGYMREGVNNSIKLKGFGYLDKFKRTIVHDMFKGYRTYEDIITNPVDGLLVKYASEINGLKVQQTGKSLTQHDTMVFNYVTLYEALTRFKDLMGDWCVGVSPEKSLIFEPAGCTDQVKSITDFDNIYFETTDELLVNSLYVLGGEDFTPIGKTNWNATASHYSNYANMAFGGVLYGNTRAQSHSTDAYIKSKTITKTHTTNAFITNRPTKTHTTNSYITAQGMIKTHVTDACIRPPGMYRVHYTDSKIKAIQSATHTTDTRVVVKYTKIHTTNCLIRATKYHKTDCVVKVLSQLSKTHTTNTYIYVSGGGTANYYVATNGNDNNPGTQTSPWRTIQKAANTLNGGQMAYVRGGTYSEQVTITRSGSSGNYITISAYPGETVIVNPSYSGTYQGSIDIRNNSWVKIVGITIAGSSSSNWCGVWIYGANNIYIQNCTVHDIRRSGLYAEQSSYITYDGCTVYATQQAGFDSPGQQNENVNMIRVSNFEIKYCHVYSTANFESIDCKEGGSYGLIHHNDISPGTSCGIYIDAQGGNMSNIDIYNNYIHGGGDGVRGIAIGVEVSGSVQHCKIYNNIINAVGASGIVPGTSYSNGTVNDIVVVNNTVYNSGWSTGWGDGLCVEYGGASNIVLRNNISYGNRSDLQQGNAIMDHNMISQNPNFVNPGAGTAEGLQLSPSSGAINSGSSTAFVPADDYGGNARPHGGSYDRGAWEYMLNSPPNILLNPGFESGRTPTLDNWLFVRQEQYDNTPVLDDTIYHSGSRSVKITIPGSVDERSGRVISDMYPAKTGKVYKFSAWIKGAGLGGTNPPSVHAVEYDKDRFMLRETTIYFPQGTYDWIEKQDGFITGANTAYIAVYANIYNGYGTIWVDDFYLEDPDNLVLNPGLEDGTMPVQYWTLEIYNGNTPEWDDSVYYSAPTSVKISVSGTSDAVSGNLRSYFSSAPPGKAYLLEAYIKGTGLGGTNPPIIRICEYDINKNYLRELDIPCPQGSYDWTYKSGDYTTGANCAYVAVVVNIYNGYGTFWIDNIYLSSVERLQGNPGFEDANGSTTVPYLWDFVPNNGNTPLWDNSVAHYQSKSVRISVPGTTDAISGCLSGEYPYMPGGGGATFHITAWGKGEGLGGTNPPAVRLYEFDDNYNYLRNTAIYFPQGTYDWTYREQYITSGHDCFHIAVVVDIYNGYGTFWVDDLYLWGSMNILENPTLDSGSPTCPHWTFLGFGTDTFLDATVSHAGVRSIKLHIPGTSDGLAGGAYTDPFVSSEPGTQYTFSAWAKGEGLGGTNPPFIAVQEFNSSGTKLRESIKYFSQGTYDWTYFDSTFITGADTAFIQVYCNIYLGYGTVWIDDFSLIKLRNIYDGTTQGWTTGADQVENMWFLLDTGTIQPIARMIVDSKFVLWGTEVTTYYPRFYKVEASQDNIKWDIIYQQTEGITNRDYLLIIDFPLQLYRYIKITLIASAGGFWWAIGALELYNKYSVITRRQDSESIDKYGLYESVIRDTTLSTKPQVVYRGQAELAKRKKPITYGVIELAYFYDASPNELITVSIPDTPYSEKFLVEKVIFYEDTWGSFKEIISVRSR